MLPIFGLVLCFIGWSQSAGDDKIVGGRINRDMSKTPYVVSIHLDDPAVKRNPPPVLWDQICVGTIFTALYVVTACHCVVGQNADGTVYSLVDAFPLDKWAFLAGAWDLRFPDYTQNPLTQRRTPGFIRHHPKCQPERTPWLRNSVPLNDVAVAKMAKPFEVDNNVKPVKVFSFRTAAFKQSLDEIINDKKHIRCSVSGWGSTLDIPILDALVVNRTAHKTAANNIPGVPDEDRYKLKLIKVQVRYEEDCLEGLVRAIKKYAGADVIEDWFAFKAKFRETLRNQVCASNKNASPCKGDSGSGLICDSQYIIGINSFGLGCGTSAPDVFQSVLAVLDWLEEVVCPVKTCEDVKHLHSECDTSANEDFIKSCLATEPPPTAVPPRRAGTDTIPSAAPVIAYTRWLIILMMNIT